MVLGDVRPSFSDSSQTWPTRFLTSVRMHAPESMTFVSTEPPPRGAVGPETIVLSFQRTSHRAGAAPPARAVPSAARRGKDVVRRGIGCPFPRHHDPPRTAMLAALHRPREDSSLRL